MLFLLSNLALVAWISSKLQVEAFLITVGPAVRPKCLVRHASRWISNVSTKRTSTVGAGYPHLRVSTGENTVELPMGTSSNQKEGKQALDALIEQFLSPENGNMTATVEEYLDLCDHAFLTHLRGRTAMTEGAQPSTANALRQVEEEINMAMQRRLAAADINLRCVLDLAPDVKRMEGKLRTLFSEGKVDMAFMVMINMNLERAKQAQVSEEATKLLTHLTTFIMELQDKRLNPEIKLLRSLLRTDCDGIRKSMLKEHLQLPIYDIFSESRLDKNKVEPDLLQRAIADVAVQIEELGEIADAGLKKILQGLQDEIDDVIKGNQRPGPFRK